MMLKSAAAFAAGLAVTALCLSGSYAFAAECKGMEKKQCEESSTCTWVKSYTTSSGKKVAAYCRTKPTPKKTKK